tara:strand:- start:86 stop:205 length:120 start_codon:yes stop_codon:yes gene_type:complete
LVFNIVYREAVRCKFLEEIFYKYAIEINIKKEDKNLEKK